MTRPAGLVALSEGRVEAVTGVPAELTLVEARTVLELDEERTTQARLGESREEAAAYSATLAPGALMYTGGIWVYARDEQVVLVAGFGPTDLAGELVGAPDLGEPEARLDAALGTLVLPDSELVYATRGMALRTNPDNGLLLAVLLFAPMSLADYVRGIRPPAGARRHLELPFPENPR